jgi:hypothetical protein
VRASLTLLDQRGVVPDELSSRRLNLNDLRPHIRKKHRTIRAGVYLGKVQNPDALQGFGWHENYLKSSVTFLYLHSPDGRPTNFSVEE